MLLLFCVPYIFKDGVAWVFGIDVSLTCPGFAVLENGKSRLITSLKTRQKGPARWHEIALVFSKILEEYPINGVVFEGYGYASQRLGDLAEIGGILRYFCFSQNLIFGSVAPATLKKFFTGYGHSDKNAMMKQAFSRGYICRNDNEADAVALALYGQINGLQSLPNLYMPSNAPKGTPKFI